MNSVVSDFKDEVGETVKDIVKIAKKQLASKPPADQGSDKKDVVTGKPVPTKKMLTQLTQQTAQLSQLRLKKVREELEKQRLKTSPPASVSPAADSGEAKKPKEDIVAKTLKGSKSTGEFKGLIGG